MHAAEAAVFAAPTPGVSAAQRWLQKGNLAAQHAAAGAFDSAMRLLNRYTCASQALLPCYCVSQLVMLLWSHFVLMRLSLAALRILRVNSAKGETIPVDPKAQ